MLLASRYVSIRQLEGRNSITPESARPDLALEIHSHSYQTYLCLFEGEFFDLR